MGDTELDADSDRITGEQTEVPIYVARNSSRAHFGLHVGPASRARGSTASEELGAHLWG